MYLLFLETGCYSTTLFGVPSMFLETGCYSATLLLSDYVASNDLVVGKSEKTWDEGVVG
jgi:hypothetical protein